MLGTLARRPCPRSVSGRPSPLAGPTLTLPARTTFREVLLALGSGPSPPPPPSCSPLAAPAARPPAPHAEVAARLRQPGVTVPRTQAAPTVCPTESPLRLEEEFGSHPDDAPSRPPPPRPSQKRKGDQEEKRPAEPPPPVLRPVPKAAWFAAGRAKAAQTAASPTPAPGTPAPSSAATAKPPVPLPKRPEGARPPPFLMWTPAWAPPSWVSPVLPPAMVAHERIIPALGAPARPPRFARSSPLPLSARLPPSGRSPTARSPSPAAAAPCEPTAAHPFSAACRLP